MTVAEMPEMLTRTSQQAEREKFLKIKKEFYHKTYVSGWDGSTLMTKIIMYKDVQYKQTANKLIL